MLDIITARGNISIEVLTYFTSQQRMGNMLFISYIYKPVVPPFLCYSHSVCPSILFDITGFCNVEGWSEDTWTVHWIWPLVTSAIPVTYCHTLSDVKSQAQPSHKAQQNMFQLSSQWKWHWTLRKSIKRNFLIDHIIGWDMDTIIQTTVHTVLQISLMQLFVVKYA